MTATSAETVGAGRTVHRLRLAAVCLGLAVLAFLQSPGRLVADTKLDLAVDPIGFLARAATLWDDQGFFGQLQNQAYGYFFPMGTFFATGHLLSVPPWVVQRGWDATLLVAAFLGTYLVARALGVADRRAAVVGGLVYALAPRMLTLLGPVSAEVLPMAMAPWVLLPLVRGAQRGSARRAAALSGVALLMAGGINAVAVAAVLPVPALWLLTRGPGPRRRALLAWWTVAVGLASLWWAVPLLLLGRYSPPFLDWIESSAVTTSVTTPLEILRGTGHWAAYAIGIDGAVWPAGWALVSTPAAVLATTALALAGLLGLLRWTPHRGFLVAGVVTGTVLVGLGHVGAFSAPWAEGMRALLDGPLAPLRNVHKADVVLRLPLALGVAALLADPPWPAPLPRGYRRPWAQVLTAAVVVSALIVTITPALLGRLAPRGAFTQVPDYWQQAADWLGENGSSRSLLVPASPFGTYMWGAPRDEPLQPLATTPWAVRDVVPLSSAGNIRLLDAVEKRLASGRASPGLADVLTGAGVSQLLVRNDLDWVRSGSARPELVRQALSGSPGLERVAGFGPPVDVSPDLAGARRGEGPMRSLEVWRVSGDAPLVSAPAAHGTLRVSGGPESLLVAADSGLLAGRAAVLAGDDPGVVDPSPLPVQTDGNRDRERSFAVVRSAESETFTDRDEPRLERRVNDYLVRPGREYRTTAELIGAESVTASSSASDVDSLVGHDPSALPWAALDGTVRTGWRSGELTGAVGQWWQVRFDQPRSLDGVVVRTDPAGSDGDRPVTLRVRTDESDELVDLDATRSVHRLPPLGTSSVLRLQLAAVASGGRGGSFAVAEVEVPGPPVERTLRAPLSGPESVPVPGALLFQADPAPATGCLQVMDRPRCGPSLVVRGEDDPGLDRSVSTAVDAEYVVEAEVVARPGEALDRLLAGGSPQVTATSSLVDHPWAAPAAMVDGDLGTGWRAQPGAPVTFTVDLPDASARAIALVLRTSSSLAAARPVEVEVTQGRVRETATVDPDGRVDLPAASRGRVEVRVLSATVGDAEPVPVEELAVPVGISEVGLRDEDGRVVFWGPRGADTLSVPCGEGPDVLVSGARLPTSLTASRADLLAGRPLSLTLCGDDRDRIRLGPGEQRVRLASSSLWIADRLALLPRQVAEPVTGRSVDVVRWTTTGRSVDVSPGPAPAYLAVAENHNPGWAATLDGAELVPVRLEGWKQGFVVPAGAGGRVELVFTPQSVYRGALLAGAAAVLVLLLLVRVRGRPSGPPTGRGSRRLPAAPSLLVAGLALAGWWGMALGAAAWLVALLPPRLRQPAAATTVTVAIAAAGVLSARRPWGSAAPFSTTGAGELLVVLAVLAALSVALGPRLPAVGGSQDGALQQLPARGADSQAPGQREHQHEPEASREGGRARQLEHQTEHQEMPEEDAVGDGPQPAQHP